MAAVRDDCNKPVLLALVALPRRRRDGHGTRGHLADSPLLIRLTDMTMVVVTRTSCTHSVRRGVGLSVARRAHRHQHMHVTLDLTPQLS